jgi:ubiquinone/menaquinone biosynthesis C-methylase UbiE
MGDMKVAEAYVTKRYRRWQRTSVDYKYKQKKAARIERILRDTGGLRSPMLELGVGPGGIAAMLSRRTAHVVGIDISPEALERAREHCKSHHVSLIRGSGFSLPFRDASFPAVYASQVVHLFTAQERLALMHEVFRVLEADGRFVFDMKNLWTHAIRYLTSTAQRRKKNFPTTSELLDLLHRSGFVDVIKTPGLLPLLSSAYVPNSIGFRQFAHTTFFVAFRPGPRPRSRAHS